MSPTPLPREGVAIRELRATEWQAYRTLRLHALVDAPDAFSTLYAQAAAQPDEYWEERLAALSADADLLLVAEGDAQLAALVWGRLDTDGAAAFVYQMWVAPELRGHGVGRALLKKVIDWAKGWGAATITLGVTQGNGPAYRLYESVGFQPVGESEPLRPNSTLRAQTMRLDISAPTPNA